MARLTTGFTATIVVCAIFNVLSEAGRATSKGDDALIPCKGTKSGHNLSYQWSRGISSSPLSDYPEMKGRISVSANGALLINHFTKKDHGKYVCVIKSGNSLLEEISVDVDDNYLLEAEHCFPGSCIEASKCTTPTSRLSCPENGEVCCSMIREKDRHRCRHFLGECMASCNTVTLKRNADDCEDGTTCCVLV
ncbi:uncharacterized protein LOC131663961 [Phymastichus coffea]|uniref:uncharacterized protein LOC131663961 n=1 Tax=Phymastichus coffea TaxID=108790 RepID=UPI00273B5E12|nr:uncharacterized protein LOC131663961 [Phymastichus coffea]XP_058790749.1 uncharacterized protein LOC131663961 [Phymastichus coffea]